MENIVMGILAHVDAGKTTLSEDVYKRQIITLSNIIIQSQINTLGVTAVASFTVYFRVELIVYLPIIALGQAVVSFVGQNYGAGNWNRIKKGNKFSILGGSFATFIACILLIIAMPVILKAFTKDTAVAAQTLEIIKVTFPFYFFYTVLECFSSNLRGDVYKRQGHAICIL